MAFNNPSKPSNMPIGMDLVELQDKMKFMPPQWLKAQVDNQTPAALPAAMRLSELAGIEQQQRAAQAQGASQQPTVVEAAAQQLGIGSLAPPQAPQAQQAAPPQAAPPQAPQRPPMAPPQAAPQQAPQPAPRQRPPMTPQLAQALQMAMAQRQGGQGQQGIKSLARGGAIAFSSRGDVPGADDTDERTRLEVDKAVALMKGDQALADTIDARIAGISGGINSSSPPPVESQIPTSSEDFFKYATTLSPQEVAFQKALTGHQEYIQKRKPAGLTEDARRAMVDRSFKENQAVSEPFYNNQAGLLSKEREAATKEGKDFNAPLYFGLKALSTAPVVGTSSLASAGVDTLAQIAKIRKNEAAALMEARKGEMALLKSREAGERGDRTAAQAYADKHEQHLIKQQDLEDNARKDMLFIQEKSAGSAASTRRNTADELYRAYTAKEAKLSREQIAEANRIAANERAAEAVEQRREAARIRADTRAAAKSPLLMQQAKYYLDQLDTIEKQILVLTKDMSPFLPKAEKASKTAQLDTLRSQQTNIYKEYAKILGTLPPISGAPSGGQKEVSFADAIKTR